MTDNAVYASNTGRGVEFFYSPSFYLRISKGHSCSPSYSRRYWLSKLSPDHRTSVERGRELLRCQPCTQLPSLPPEIIGLIATHLCIPDLHRFSATSHRMLDCVAHLLLQAIVLDGEHPSSMSTPVWSASAQSRLVDLPKRLTIWNYAVHLPNFDHFRFLVVLRLISCDLRQQFGFFDTVFCLRELRILSFLYTHLPPFPVALVPRIPELLITELDCIMHITDDPAKCTLLELLHLPRLETLRLSLCQVTVQFVSQCNLHKNLSHVQTLELHGANHSPMDEVQTATFCRSFSGVRRLQLVDMTEYTVSTLDFKLPLLDTLHGKLHSNLISSCASRLRHVVLGSVITTALSRALVNLPSLESFEARLDKWRPVAFTFPEQFFPNVVDLRLRYGSGGPELVFGMFGHSVAVLTLQQADMKDFFTNRLPRLPNLRVFHILFFSITGRTYQNVVEDLFKTYWMRLENDNLSEVRLQRHSVWRKPEGNGWNMILETTETSSGLLYDFS